MIWISCAVKNRPFAVSHSCHSGTRRQTKGTHNLNGNFLCLSSPSATFPLQHGGFVPCEWLAAKGLLVAYPTCHPTHQTLCASLYTYFVQLELVSPNGCVSSCYI